MGCVRMTYARNMDISLTILEAEILSLRLNLSEPLEERTDLIGGPELMNQTGNGGEACRCSMRLSKTEKIHVRRIQVDHSVIFLPHNAVVS